MNNRIEIKIVVVGEADSGKETFAKMLFLDNVSKNRIDPLSKLSEMYIEIDPLNFQTTSKKIIEECDKNNNLIMQQNEISNIRQLRDAGIEPLFYKHIKRIRDLINYNNKGISQEIHIHMNKNIFLTFYFIGNNYLEFEKEINCANIMIYITDIMKFQNKSMLFDYLVGIIGKSGNEKYMLTLINKSDILNSNDKYNILDIFNQKIKEILTLNAETTNEHNIHQYMLLPIVLTFKYAHIYRQITHKNNIDICPSDKIFISDTFMVKKENIFKDIQQNELKYLRHSGFIAFNDLLSDILNTKSKSMVDHNFKRDLEFLEELFSVSRHEFLLGFITLRNKANNLGKIFKKDYHSNIIKLSIKCLKKISLLSDPEIDIIDKIKEYYGNDKNLKAQIDIVYGKIITSVTERLYRTDITEDIFLPSKIHIFFDKICDLCPPKEEIKKLSVHICELYSIKARQILLSTQPNVDLLFSTYFSPIESTKMMSMFNEIKSMISFEVFKTYLLQILLTKLMVAEKCINYDNNKEITDKIITYCRSIKYYLLNNSNKQYHFLFNNICDICTNMLYRLNGFYQILHISENIDFITNFRPDQIIKFDKFIIKTIKKNSYQSSIADDGNDSNEDSDTDIYDDNHNNENKLSEFEFTKDGSDLDSEKNEEKNNINRKKCQIDTIKLVNV
jgi:hypothetical protein